MAARSGAGTGVVVSLVVFIICTVALLVFTIVFYARQNEAMEGASRARQDLEAIADAQVRQRDDVQAMRAEAGSRSLLAHMLEQRQRLLSKVTGNPDTRVDQVGAEFRAYGVGENESIRSAMARMQSDLNALRGELEAKNQQLAQMEQLVQQKDQQLAQATSNRNQAVEQVTGRISDYASSVDNYKQQVDQTIATVNQTIENQQNAFSQTRAELEQTIDGLRNQLAIKDGRLAQYEEAFNRTRLYAKDPSRLVDARILESPRGNTVFIDRGRQDKIVLGMTFEVYDDAASITPDPVTGELPRGKASIQVVSVGETTSTAQVTRNITGRPVVRGDVVANAVYDPSRTYSFLVHGVFDLNGDGRPTEGEAGDIRRMIESWGGEVIPGDELRGDLDFLVLGVQPQKPPALRNNATGPEIEIWVKQNAAWQKYNDLFRQAMDANIPVLNANRFFTLTGYTQR